MEIDKETKKVLDRGKAVKEMLDSEGWKIVQDILIESISDISNLTTITTSNPDELVKEVGAKQLAANALANWLSDINNIANQYDSNRNYKQKNEDYILHIEPEPDRT